MSERKSASEIAAEILIAGFGQQFVFSRDEKENAHITEALCANFTKLHRAILEAQKREAQTLDNQESQAS